jgi:hypothetical protein
MLLTKAKPFLNTHRNVHHFLLEEEYGEGAKTYKGGNKTEQNETAKLA